MKSPSTTNSAAATAASRPLLALTIFFAAWKCFLLAVALGGAAIADDYDTSTSLFFRLAYGPSTSLSGVTPRLARWDAIYFLHAARKGYVYEQEWAFGTGLPLLVRFLGSALRGLGVAPDVATALEPVVAVAVAHLSHFASVIVLYKLTMAMNPRDGKAAFLASALHIVSPAGLFLSAPYGESFHSCLSFMGTLLFARSLANDAHAAKLSLLRMGAGVSFGLATAFRSNGILNGLLFAVSAAGDLYSLSHGPTLGKMSTLAATIVGGLCVAIGAVAPQAVAWKRYCSLRGAHVELRPWCYHRLPSIYDFVQEEYWDNGFLRYWTLNRLPLFILAAPMLFILLASGVQVFRKPTSAFNATTPEASANIQTFLRVLAAIQALLATMVLLRHHVQIISRLSSGYPLWYWWVAALLLDKKRHRRGRVIVIFMVMYAGVQGGLFASFLPPA